MEAYQRIVLASRPVAAPTLDTFRLETGAMPRPAAGQLLVRTQYLSLDPYMRGRMGSAASYAQPVAVAATTEGEAISGVRQSRRAAHHGGGIMRPTCRWSPTHRSYASDARSRRSP